MMNSGPQADRVMVCRECGKTFYFSAAGQEFFQEQGFSEAPKRCRACREKRRDERRSGNSQNGSGGRFPAICWSCQRHVMVPFKPAPGRPVYCRVCYSAQKRHGLA